MMKNKLYILLALIISVSIPSCVRDTVIQVKPLGELRINISATYPVVSTRADANGFISGDGVGIFVIDYDSSGNAGEVKMNGVRAANALFEYDGFTWRAPYDIYWADKSTPADFVGYYPYDMFMDTPTHYPFSVKSLQSSDDATTTAGAGYEASDFLWAKATKVYPTEETIDLQYRHLMAGINIRLEMGEGFAEDEWATLSKRVIIGRTELSGHINLSDGSVTVAEGDRDFITPLQYEDAWRAVVIPQTVGAGASLVVIDVEGQSYNFTREDSMVFRSGMMHNFTIKVNRREGSGDFEFEAVAEDVVDWVDDPELHDGIVREYIIIHIDEPGTLRAKVDAMDRDYLEIDALKITGVINHDDLRFIGEHLVSMTALNLRDVTITGNDDEKDAIGWIGGRQHSGNRGTLRHIVLPKNLKKICDGAFKNLSLVGSINIPDSVEYIGWAAFFENYLYGELILPSSLKFLGAEAFAFNPGISGQLYLPEGIEVIEWEPHRGVFGDNQFTGPLILPSSLTRYGRLGFAGTTGTVTLPPKVTYVPEFILEGSGCTKVNFHNGITEIRGAAFRGSSLSGELVLPPNLKYIGSEAFSDSKISSIIFPESLMVIEDGGYDFAGTFSNCKYLTGVLELPKNVARIPIGCFYGCSNITGLIIPENCELIEAKAFYECSSIGSIVCQATEPPLLGDDAFYGVSKDNFTLEVPKGCVNAYKLAPGWSEFKRIAEYSDFVCRPAQANALNNVHSELLVLNASGKWQVKECPEWVNLNATSGEGKTELRLTFTELQHGAGNRNGTVTFVMPEEGYETTIDVAQYDYEYEEDSLLTLREHTEGNGGINILFIGDGFDGATISDGSYLNLVEEQVEHFFGLEPYESLRGYFDVHVLFPLSQERGVNTMHRYVNNHFGTLYGYDGKLCTSNQLITSVDEVIEYAEELVPEISSNRHKTLIVLVPNDDAYESSTIYADVTISICPPSSRPYPQDTRGVIQHEAGGHGFGKLADESIIYSQWLPISVGSEIEDYHRRGWYRNISANSKFNNVPWSDFIFDTRYSDRVDIFEGAFGYMRGVYRSEINSCMNYGIPYYNTISRLDIIKRIFEYGGTQFSMDYFYENDTFEWGSREAETRATSQALIDANAFTSSNGHISPIMCDGRAMGDAVRAIREEVRLKSEK